ncbi:MAG: rod shape-determining protein MreC [Holosporales bacterium]|jgi:rod shape-determining protein MreC|nr:rod shape-determining protein MreC [Holosporales bacterium]
MRGSESRHGQKFFLVLLAKFAPRRGTFQANRSLIASLVACILIVCDLTGFSYVGNVRCYLSKKVFFIKIVANKLTEIPKVISKYVAIKNENERLRFELDKFKIKTVMSSWAERELEELRELANLRYKSDLFKNMEKILGFDNSIYDSFMLISATHDCTKDGAVVISSDGLVGIIFDVCTELGRVLPITNQRMSIPVKSQNGEHLIISGTGNNSMISKEVMTNSVSNFEIGEILVTSGAGGVFEKNIPVARITQIDAAKIEVVAQPLAEIAGLSFVWVVNPRF